MPQLRLQQFQANVARARDLVGLGQGIGNLTSGRVDSSDMYRAALVQAVAALDSYVHGVVLDRAVDLLLGRVNYSASGTKVGLSFPAIQDILTAGSPVAVELAARTHVAQRLALETFQKPDDVAKAFAMVGVPKIWSRGFSNSEKAKEALGLVVNRRNRIVHSCDIDPLTPGAVTPLSSADSLSAVVTVETTVLSIDALC